VLRTWYTIHFHLFDLADSVLPLPLKLLPMTLVTSFTMSKVDYCNVALAGLSQYELDRVQSVVNAAARLTADARKYDHVTQLLMDLHW